MMNFIFFFFSTLGMVLIQTVVLPDFSWFPHCFDLMIINVLYLSLVYPGYWAGFWLMIIGIIMDSLSGAPFFLHTMAYISIYLIIFFLRRLVFPRSTIFVFIVGLASVCIYQALVIFSVFLLQGRNAISAADYSLYIGQVIWAAIGIPMGVWLLETMHQSFLHALKQSHRG